MEIINGAEHLPVSGRALYLALGNFDGVHRGHQMIIRKTIEAAKTGGGISAALIFDPHPVIVLHPERPFALLSELADRAEIMSELGLQYLIVEPFTAEISHLSPEHFVLNYLLDKLGVKAVFTGSDYSFGKQGAGNAETMRYWGEKLGFSVDISSMLKYKGKEVSSSRIRTLLLSGAVKEAAELLNYYFFRTGKVIKGYGIGKQMIYPTANIAASPRLLWPGRGVYLTAVGNLNGGCLFGVTNVGSRPTFGHYDTSVETHILDFSGTIYNYSIRLSFLEKLRETKTFSSPQQLKEQISYDIEAGRKLIPCYEQEKFGSGNPLQPGCSVLRS
ncbi:MAG: bifunctional riboflavin kinase/FAD synthetase [Bacillota bacterium]|nr:bifunctional riboflavin kinase/FAD synthetase [Bacillota bacterium]